MESLWENKALLYALSGTASFILILALGWLPELDEQFGIIEFPPEVSKINAEVLTFLDGRKSQCSLMSLFFSKRIEIQVGFAATHPIYTFLAN